MAKKCIYCNTALNEQSVIDVCKKCGIQVWGDKMFGAIVSNMENARDIGDLYQGSVGSAEDATRKFSTMKPEKKFSFVEDAQKILEIQEQEKQQESYFSGAQKNETAFYEGNVVTVENDGAIAEDLIDSFGKKFG